MFAALLIAWFACSGAPVARDLPVAAEVPALVPVAPAPIAEATPIAEARPIAEVTAPSDVLPTSPRDPIPGIQRPLPKTLTELPPLPGPDPTVCDDNADCELSCVPRDSCCGAPCGCRSAYNHEGAARVKAYADATCPSVREDCPAVGCAREDARFAACVAGHCRAVDDFPGPAVVGCPTQASSTLAGVSIRLGGPCEVSLADAVAGIDLPYTVVVTLPVAVFVNTPDGGHCISDGPGGLPVGAQVGDDRHVWDPNGDNGLCAPQNRDVRTLAAGTHRASLHFEARDWFGRSDTNNPKGAVWPPGTYTFRVSGSGTVDGRPFVVQASRTITVR